MPTYYFNVRDEKNFREDTSGTEVPNLEAAREHALELARNAIAKKIERGEILDGQRFEISDRSGSILAEIPFRDALRLG